MFWKFAEVGVMKSPPVFVERSREVYTLARTDCFLRSALETPEAGVVLVCCMLLCLLFGLCFEVELLEVLESLWEPFDSILGPGGVQKGLKIKAVL